MSLYHHLTVSDREVILLGVHTGKTQQEIADQIGCSKSTVNRELNRNGGWQNYSSTNAQRNYEHRRQNSRRPRLLAQQGLRTLIVKYIVEYHWSPEQIAARLRHENSSWQISYVTIYRGIYLDNLKVPYTSHGARGLPRRLRHRGKTRKVKGTVNERRGRFNAAPSIHERRASKSVRTLGRRHSARQGGPLCLGHIG